MSPTEETSTQLTERQKKAFDYAGDVSKQLITLATAIIAATTAFHKDILGHETGWGFAAMCAAWACFLLSAAGGIGSLMALTGTLSDREIADSNITPYARNIVVLARAQIWLFLGGLALTIAYAVMAVLGDKLGR